MCEKLIKDVMSSPAICCNSNSKIKEVIEIFKKNDIGFIPVLKNNFFIGVVTDRDILIRGTGKHNLNSPIEKVMTSGTLHFTHPNAKLKEAAKIMADYKVRRLVVLDDGKVVGVVTSKNLLKDSDSLKYIISTYQKNPTLPNYQMYSNSNPHDCIKTSDFPL